MLLHHQGGVILCKFRWWLGAEHATSYYMNQIWPSLIMPYDSTRLQWVNIMFREFAFHQWMSSQRWDLKLQWIFLSWKEDSFYKWIIYCIYEQRTPGSPILSHHTLISHSIWFAFLLHGFLQLCFAWLFQLITLISKTSNTSFFSQMTFSNAFSRTKMYKFCLKFHWRLFPRLKLTIFQHWLW